VAFGLFVVGLAWLAPDLVAATPGEVAAATGGYLLLAVAPGVTRRLGRSHLLPIIGATLLLDGIYLAWAAYVSGGAQSPLRFLVYLHVVAVALLGSYRTGLKIAAWHSLLLLVAFYAQTGGYLEVKETIVSPVPAEGDDLYLLSMLGVAALWAVALGAAAFSALNERELRAQKVDLEHLSAMVAEVDERATAEDIPGILVHRVCDLFGFPRGVVLVSRDDNLSVMAHRGPLPAPRLPTGVDPLMERAWHTRRSVLVRRIDPEADPRLASLLPDGRNLVVVPMFRDRGKRLGILVLERAGRSGSVKRWVVAMIEQFASHAALAMHNAWLLEEIERHNAVLEATVQERTRELSDSLRDLRIMDGQRRRLLSRLVTAEEEERRRIANDIHDGPVQQVAAARMNVDRLRMQLQDPEPLHVVERIWSALGEALKGLRDRLFQLRPTTLDHEGLEAALRHALSSLDGQVAVALEARLSREPPPETQIILYRIAEEALANIRKHARAARVEVFLGERDGGVSVRIQDDGAGFVPPTTLQSSPGHLGLTSMRERAEMAGGSCEIRSRPGGGTAVEVWVPVRVLAESAYPGTTR
jgi:signal transduction histidine kinase